MFSSLRFGLGVALLSSALALPGLAAEGDHPLDLQVQSAKAKVGEPTEVIATITVHEGYRPMASYRNRIIELSSLDDSVDFDQEVVAGSIEGGQMSFAVGVTPTKPGEHPINGVLRVGYIGDLQARMISIPLITTVTGTE